MKIIGTNKNGDEIAEVSVTELDTMFKEIRNKTIDEFYNKCGEKIFKNDMDLSMTDITLISRQLKEVEDV